MLESLSVKNFILIDELHIDFYKGLSVITGETGAGKSILLDAILFCLGYELSNKVVKRGRDRTVVSITFSLSNKLKFFLEQLCIECNDVLLIRVNQKSEGRRSYFINDQTVSRATVQRLASHLLEVHGQNSNSSLLEESTHQHILDDFGNLTQEVLEVSKSFSDWQNILKEIDVIDKKKDSIEREIDYLSFVIQELNNLAVQDGEEEKLATIRVNLQNGEKELSLLQNISQCINNPEIDRALSKASKLLSRQSEREEFILLINSIEDICSKFEFVKEQLCNIENRLIVDGEYNLEEIEDRLFAIRAVGRKYKIDTSELQNFLSESEKELDRLKSQISSSEELQIQEVIARKRYYDVAKDLNSKRLLAAKNLEEKMRHELSHLGMANTVFSIAISDKGSPSASGVDSVVFIASTNPGSEAEAISKIASGGELSRFMLSLKTSLMDKAVRPTVLFDEIDVGVGGEVAGKIGERLKKLSEITQVVVVTHQPQIAGKADSHIKVEKVHIDETTEVRIKLLDNVQRQKEIARMIFGKVMTETRLEAVKELIHD